MISVNDWDLELISRHLSLVPVNKQAPVSVTGACYDFVYPSTHAGVALEPKKLPILIFCPQFSNIEAKLWFHFLSSRFLSHFCKYMYTS